MMGTSEEKMEKSDSDLLLRSELNTVVVVVVVVLAVYDENDNDEVNSNNHYSNIALKKLTAVNFRLLKYMIQIFLGYFK